MADTKFHELMKYARNDKDVELLDVLSQGMSQRHAADVLCVGLRTLQRRLAEIKANASLHGYAPENDMVHESPLTHIVKGTSTLYKGDEQILQWVKTDKKAEEITKVLRDVVDAMKEDIIAIEQPLIDDREFETDIIPFIVIGDAHVNMMAHASEVGHDFDLATVELELCKAIKMLVDEMPAYERVVICDLGDFTHAENTAGVTAHSGHALDLDKSYPSMIKTAVRIMKFIVNECLQKFKYVDVICNQGNHSRVNDFWMAEMFRQLYEKCDRVTVLNNENVFIPYRMGNTFVMTHHGDKCRPDRIASVMASDYPEDFGETTYRMIFTGHVHHRSVAKEHNGVTVESFNTLAPRDKYAHDHGYRSGSSVTAVLLSKTYGEVGRFKIPVELVRNSIYKMIGSDYDVFENKRKKVHTV